MGLEQSSYTMSTHSFLVTGLQVVPCTNETLVTGTGTSTVLLAQVEKDSRGGLAGPHLDSMAWKGTSFSASLQSCHVTSSQSSSPDQTFFPSTTFHPVSQLRLVTGLHSGTCLMWLTTTSTGVHSNRSTNWSSTTALVPLPPSPLLPLPRACTRTDPRTGPRRQLWCLYLRRHYCHFRSLHHCRRRCRLLRRCRYHRRHRHCPVRCRRVGRSDWRRRRRRCRHRRRSRLPDRHCPVFLSTPYCTHW